MEELIQTEEVSAKQLFLGIDGGGSKTEFAIIDKYGHLYGNFTLLQSNPNVIGVDSSIELLAEGIERALNEFSNIRNVFAGIAGALTGNNRMQIKEGLAKYFTGLNIDVDGDVSNLLFMDDNCDSALIIGTGIALVCKTGGERTIIGGRGNMLDQFGSGFCLGREVINTSLDEIETNDEKSMITRLFCENYSISGRNIIKDVYEKGEAFVASFAHILFEAYNLGDEKAGKILENHAEKVAKLIKLSQNKYNCGKSVITGGGIAQHYEKPYLQMIQKYADVNFVVPALPQIYGAARKCVYNKLGGTGKEFENNFTSDYLRVGKNA